jgi:hypothetical protein
MQHLEIKNNTKLFSLKSKFRERSLFMAWGGGGHRREKGWVNKSLSEDKVGWTENKTTQGLGYTFIVISKAWLTQINGNVNGNVNSHMSTLYINKSESLSWSFSNLSGGKWCLQRKYMCRQHETLDCRKLHKLLSNSCHRSGKWCVSYGNATVQIRKVPAS